MRETPLVPLRDISTHIKDGTHGTHKRVESGVPLLSAKNVGKNGRLHWDKSDDLIGEADYAALNAQFTPKTNDLLLTVVGSIGRSALFDGARVAFQRSVAFVRCTEAVAPAYLYQATCSPSFVRQLERRCNVTAQAGLYLGELAKITIPLPLRERQEEIARVLASIDTAIERTEALIAKHHQIKAGLMHDLFTRGVLPNGQLRPRHSEAPELYQETPLGWIPADWRFTTCESVCEKVIDCKNRTPPEAPDGYPVIRTPNVRDGEFVDAELAFTDEKSYAVWTMRGKPKVGDIVITREAPVGEVCMIPERHPHACLGQRMMLYRPSQNLIFPRYLLYALQSQQIKNRLELISGGSTVGHVRVGDIRALWMFMPESREEQTQIADALDGVTDRLKREANQLEKLQKQKLGLMQDLLTGRVSVDHLVAKAANA